MAFGEAHSGMAICTVREIDTVWTMKHVLLSNVIFSLQDRQLDSYPTISSIVALPKKGSLVSSGGASLLIPGVAMAAL